MTGSRICPTCSQYVPTHWERWGIEVRQAREQLCTTKFDLCLELRLSSEMLTEIELGRRKPHDKTIDRLVDYLGVSDPRTQTTQETR